MEMDSAALLAACKRHRLYQTPALNDKLYANFQGFTCIAGLEPYTGLRALFLEGNALDSAAGLPPLPELRCLFLQQNALTSLAPPTLGRLPQLDTLNLGGNALASLEGLEGCTQLRTLVAADNQLATAGGLAPLAACTHLESLDLQNNRLEDGASLLALLAPLPHLKCLYLRGNPLVSALPSYRKAVIAALPGLTYLDDRPIAELERACAEAWAKGGLEAEREARAAFHQREREREQRQVAALREIREAGWRKRREALGLSPEGGDPYLEGLPGAAEQEPEEEEEPAELRAARDRLAAFTAARQARRGDDEALPGLVDADVEAVLEDSRANQADLLAAAAAAIAGAAAGPKAENSCPNSTAGSSGTGAPPAVPEARQTVHFGASCGGPPAGGEAAAGAGQEAQRGAGKEVEAGEHSTAEPARSAAGAASAPPAVDSGDEGSASLASSSDSDDDYLEALD